MLNELIDDVVDAEFQDVKVTPVTLLPRISNPSDADVDGCGSRTRASRLIMTSSATSAAI